MTIAAAGRSSAGTSDQASASSARFERSPRSSAASRRRSRISRCSTYSASFAAGSVTQGPWPGQISSIGSAWSRRSESM